MAIPNTTTPDAAAEAERKRLEAEAAAKQNQSAAPSPTPAGPTPDQYSIKPAFDLPKTDFEKSVDTLSAVKPATSPAPTPVQTPATAQTQAPASAQTSAQPAPRVAGSSQQTVGTVHSKDGRVEQRDGGGTVAYDKSGRVVYQTQPTKPVQQVTPAAPVAIPDAVKATPAPAVLAPEKSMTNWGSASTGRAIGFKEAGFDSQEQYDAARAPTAPQTQIKSPVNPAWQQKQDAATAQAAGERARLDRMGTHESGFALGNAMRADTVAAAQKAMATPSLAAMKDPNGAANAAAGQAGIINRVNAQQTDANAYQENWRKQHAASAVKPALAEPVAPAQAAASPAAAAPVASAPAPSPVKPEPVASAEVNPAVAASAPHLPPVEGGPDTRMTDKPVAAAKNKAPSPISPVKSAPVDPAASIEDNLRSNPEQPVASVPDNGQNFGQRNRDAISSAFRMATRPFTQPIITSSDGSPNQLDKIASIDHRMGAYTDKTDPAYQQLLAKKNALLREREGGKLRAAVKSAPIAASPYGSGPGRV